MSSLDDRAGSKWDRAARYLKIASVLRAHGEAGISAAALAVQVGVSKRTIYRDLDAMDLDADLPIWNERGRYGLSDEAFLPPLALTLPEAMAFFLAARLLVKSVDELDTEIIGAYVKLAEVLPPVLAEQLHSVVDAYATTPRDDAFTRVLRALTQGIAERRVVVIEYAPGVYDPGKGGRTARVHPYAIEPSALTHGLYLIGHDEERGARRTFKVERIRSASVTPQGFQAPSASLADELLGAWDVISNEEPVRVVVRFKPEVAARVAETRWHPSQSTEVAPADGFLIWRARVSGVLEVRAWLLSWGADAEVLEPDMLRDWVTTEHVRALEAYRSPAG